MDFLEYVRMCQEEPDQESRQEKLCRGLIYKVEAGDTLYSISRKYKLRVRDLMSANPFVNVYNLQIGEELCIPVVINQPTEGLRPYAVKRGDTVLSILEKSGASFEELARLNRSVAALRLPPGMIILLPSKIQPRSSMGTTEEDRRMVENNETVRNRDRNSGTLNSGMSNEMTGNMGMPNNSGMSNEMTGSMRMPNNMPNNSGMPNEMTGNMGMPNNNGMSNEMTGNMGMPNNSGMPNEMTGNMGMPNNSGMPNEMTGNMGMFNNNGMPNGIMGNMDMPENNIMPGNRMENELINN